MQGIYTYIPDTKYVSREYSVAAMCCYYSWCLYHIITIIISISVSISILNIVIIIITVHKGSIKCSFFFLKYVDINAAITRINQTDIKHKLNYSPLTDDYSNLRKN